LGQQTQYTYDAYARLSEVQYYPANLGGSEDTTQRVTYSYDGSYPCALTAGQPLTAPNSTYSAGRLSGVTFGGGVTDAYQDSYCYQYAYNQAGRVITQEMTVNAAQGRHNSIGFTASYQWDYEGRMTSLQYPTVSAAGSFYTPVSMPIAAFQYDSNGRLNGMTMDDQNGYGPQPFASATYTPAGQLYQLSYGFWTETRTYNSMMQLISQSIPGVLSMTYSYSTTGANNGRIVGSTDGITGENTTYTYDALNRLSSASNSLWSQSYTFDGFGNLTSKSQANGSPNPSPAQTWTYNANNQQNGVYYDANGNSQPPASCGYYCSNTYSVENRLTWQVVGPWPNPANLYAYDPWGKRVMNGSDPNPYEDPDPTYTYNFYGITGQRLATLTCNGSNYPSYPTCAITGQNVYFGKKLIVSGGVGVVTDRLGSVRANGQGDSFAYYPYGEERTSTANGLDKFGTYFRDAVGQDYADQRYYGSGTGRFLTADPGGMATADATSPTSWNRYAYVRADPVNYADPSGAIQIYTGGGTVADCNGLFDTGSTTYDVGCTDTTGDYGCYGGTGLGLLPQPDPGCPTGGDNTPPSPPPPPACPPQFQAWINSYGADAVATGLSEANLLATSAIESGWGGGPFVKGNSFFNLETVWNPKTPKPSPKYALQVSWMTAGEMFTSGPFKGDYSLVASYNSAADSFMSFAVTLGKYLNGVTDPAKFASILVAHGINAGRASYFGNTEQTFQNCLSAQKQ
jgi:RHS repeat-associated protein